jgi:hypothetical protein
MGYVQTDLDFNLNFDVVDYTADFNLPAPTPPPLPTTPIYYKDFDSLPMEVSEKRAILANKEKILRELDCEIF